MATDTDRFELDTSDNALADDQLENVAAGTGFDRPADGLVGTAVDGTVKPSNAVGSVHLSHIKKITS